jgi:short-subunit dehydrogenase
MPQADARTVAERAWRGLRAGRRVVLPDAAAWFTALAAPFAPHRLVLPIMNLLLRNRGG